MTQKNKNIKKTTPKSLFDETLIFFEFIDLMDNYLIKINLIILSIFLIPLIQY